MGNYRFKLSDMIPNAWFYKLKDMSSKTTRNHSLKKTNHHPSSTSSKKPSHGSEFSLPRHSYYFSNEPTKDILYNSPTNLKSSDTHFPDLPKKPTAKRTKRRPTKSSSKFVTSSVSANCTCHTTFDSVWKFNEASPELSVSPELPDPISSWSSTCSCRVTSYANEIIIDMDNCSSSTTTTKKSLSKKFEKADGFDSISEIELPPILTKPAKFDELIVDVMKNEEEPAKFRRTSAKLEEKNGCKSAKEQRGHTPSRRSSSSAQASQGLKMRTNSPRLASKKIQACSRKSVSKTHRNSVSECFAIVKSSFDPQRDFRDSMVEMIVENNIRAPKDLEELLACYLSLNSNEYHNVIVKVFEQIWIDLTDIRL